MRVALSIAGSDPTGGAGMQADLRVFQHLGVHGSGVVTALTVQDSERVHQVLPAFPNVVLDQLRRLLADMLPDAVKIGMLASDDVARAVMLALDGLPPEVPIVIDPVLAASDGTPLLERRAWGTLSQLCTRAALMTPNLQEVELLTRIDPANRAGSELAARACITELGAQAVLLKGGHRAGAPDDLLAWRRSGSTGDAASEDEVELRWLEGKRIEVGRVHGTGCALASAVAAGLALGHPLEQAVDDARALVARGLEKAFSRGAGAQMLGLV